MGDEMPTPASAAFQARFSVALHFSGSPFSGDTPEVSGPRQWGQSSAATAEPSAKNRMAAISRIGSSPPQVAAGRRGISGQYARAIASDYRARRARSVPGPRVAGVS
jgi:hypothetical protein